LGEKYAVVFGFGDAEKRCSIITDKTPQISKSFEKSRPLFPTWSASHQNDEILPIDRQNTYRPAFFVEVGATHFFEAKKKIGSRANLRASVMLV